MAKYNIVMIGDHFFLLRVRSQNLGLKKLINIVFSYVFVILFTEMRHDLKCT